MPKKLEPVHHRGKILREEFMLSLALTMNRRAMDLCVPVTRIADIVNERRAIAADRALRLARNFMNAPAVWVNLQSRYELDVAEDAIADRVERDVQHVELPRS